MNLATVTMNADETLTENSKSGAFIHTGEIREANGSLASRVADAILSLGFMFFAVVVVPTLASILYFGIFASDVYISESRFIVRSPDKPSVSGLGGLLKTAGFSQSGFEAYAAQDYVLSRDALRALNVHGAFERAYGNSNISVFDRFGSLNAGRSFEDLYKMYQNKIRIEHEATSAITTLKVRAFTASDARDVNKRLLEMAEATVNRLNVRGRQDLIRYASAEVQSAKRDALNAAAALAQYRSREGIIDPEKQAAVQLQMISKLQDELITTRTQLLELRRVAPQNPQTQTLETRIKGIIQEIDQQNRTVTGVTKSLSSSLVRYQRLMIESQFADRQMVAAMASLEEAKNEARRKQAYVERIVEPNLPDRPLEPGRWRGVFATLALGLVIWGILKMLLAGIREHKT